MVQAAVTPTQQFGHHTLPIRPPLLRRGMENLMKHRFLSDASQNPFTSPQPRETSIRVDELGICHGTLPIHEFMCPNSKMPRAVFTWDWNATLELVRNPIRKQGSQIETASQNTNW